MAHKPLFKPKTSKFTTDDLIGRLDRLAEHEEDEFDELEIEAVKHLHDKAARLALVDGTVDWVPYSQMREYEGAVYISQWIKEQKGWS